MRTTKVFAVAAAVLILAGFGGWLAWPSQARVAPFEIGAKSPSILELTIRAGELPTAQYVDYTFVFN